MSWSIVVTDGEQRAALATVRSLGRAGHVVHVCSSRRRSLAGASRYCASETTLPDPLREPELYAGDVSRVCAAVNADVLFPISEPSLLAVLPHRERFSCAIPFPSLDAFLAVCDKGLVMRSAAAHGIAAPRQQLVTSPDEMLDVGSAVTFPVVLKPSRSIAGPAGDRRKVGVMYAADREALQRMLRELAPSVYPILLQERIEGPGFAISLFVWDGEVRAAFAHRRLREKPPSGGVSVLRESIPLDAELLRRSIALLEDFAWQGVAMVEFKHDQRSNTPYVMEINGRLWGSLQLAIDAGVNFPVLLADAAMGRTAAPVFTYELGVRTRWELGDLDHLFSILRRSATALNLPTGAQGRLATLGAFVRSFGPSTRREILRIDDPRPFLREAVDWLARR
jgi:predicted ATP-grasp superfamily ATP-dependent carboligase